MNLYLCSHATKCPDRKFCSLAKPHGHKGTVPSWLCALTHRLFCYYPDTLDVRCIPFGPDMPRECEE